MDYWEKAGADLNFENETSFPQRGACPLNGFWRIWLPLILIIPHH